jgi:hypothetical protein
MRLNDKLTQFNSWRIVELKLILSGEAHGSQIAFAAYIRGETCSKINWMIWVKSFSLKHLRTWQDLLVHNVFT